MDFWKQIFLSFFSHGVTVGSPLPVVLSCEIIWKRNIILVLLRFLSIDLFHYILAPKSKHKDTCLKGLAMITCMQQGTWHVSYQVLTDSEGILRQIFPVFQESKIYLIPRHYLSSLNFACFILCKYQIWWVLIFFYFLSLGVLWLQSVLLGIPG